MKITTLIVENNISEAERLSILLQSYPNISNIEISTTKEDALNKIKFFKPNTIFIDINVGEHLGFDILDECKGFFDNVIFTASHTDFVIQSMKYMTVHYLLKPVNPTDLAIAIQKLCFLHIPK